MLMYNFNQLKTLVHGWWYAYAVQRMATPPFNKVLATNGAGKQQVQIKNILKTMALYTAGAGSTPAVFRW